MAAGEVRYHSDGSGRDTYVLHEPRVLVGPRTPPLQQLLAEHAHMGKLCYVDDYKFAGQPRIKSATNAQIRQMEEARLKEIRENADKGPVLPTPRCDPLPTPPETWSLDPDKSKGISTNELASRSPVKIKSFTTAYRDVHCEPVLSNPGETPGTHMQDECYKRAPVGYSGYIPREIPFSKPPEFSNLCWRQ